MNDEITKDGDNLKVINSNAGLDPYFTYGLSNKITKFFRTSLQLQQYLHKRP
jgi:hypothetical protein